MSVLNNLREKLKKKFSEDEDREENESSQSLVSSSNSEENVSITKEMEVGSPKKSKLRDSSNTDDKLSSSIDEKKNVGFLKTLMKKFDKLKDEENNNNNNNNNNLSSNSLNLSMNEDNDFFDEKNGNEPTNELENNSVEPISPNRKSKIELQLIENYNDSKNISSSLPSIFPFISLFFSIL